MLPEEDTTKYFMVSLFLQQIYREMLSIADEHGGKLPNRVVIFGDEIGTIPKIESLEMLFSAGRSRRISMVPIIQSFAQLQKNYGKEGSEIIIDNCQGILFGGFAPNSESAGILSKALGNKTVLSGSISRGKNDPSTALHKFLRHSTRYLRQNRACKASRSPLRRRFADTLLTQVSSTMAQLFMQCCTSQSLQMISRPLMTPDELKSLPKGHFILAKTGCHPMKTELRLFFKWGIQFEEEYAVEQHMARPVYYADRLTLEQEMIRRQMAEEDSEELPEMAGDESGEVPERGIFKRAVKFEERRPLLRTD